jgi:RHH-type rel operon transcriptional repressor/antitoxin RelB
VLAIRLPEKMEKRLERLAKRTGRTKSYYAREAIALHLGALEAEFLPSRTVARVLQSGKRTSPLRKKTPLRSLEGIWADLNINITEQDIAEARREMWGNSPREIEL